MPRSLLLFFKGCCMGAADIVPGVSGGTMAFILGIYQQLIDAVREFGRKPFWDACLHLRFKQAFQIVDGSFLLVVGLGILSSVALLSRQIEHLLQTQPVLIWSFFFGLVIASVHVVSRRVAVWNTRCYSAAIIAGIGAYMFVGLVPTQTPHTPLLLMISGMIAISAGLLPGISGSFTLVLLGKYEHVLHAVNTLDFITIGYVALGALIGIALFSQVISWLLHHKHDVTVSVLIGLMLGSLRKIWPWKVEGVNVLPTFENGTFMALGMIVVGAVIVLVMESWMKQKPQQQ